MRLELQSSPGEHLSVSIGVRMQTSTDRSAGFQSWEALAGVTVSVGSAFGGGWNEEEGQQSLLVFQHRRQD